MIHPTAVSADIDVGTVVMVNAMIKTGARIGKHCIINSGTVVEHDKRISDFIHISVGAKLAATVSMRKSSWTESVGL